MPHACALGSRCSLLAAAETHPCSRSICNQVTRGSLKQQDPYDRFTKMEKVGSGASKVVYKAFDEQEGVEVAWNEVYIPDSSILREKERSRLFNEIQMLWKLRHKNILDIREWWYEEKGRLLVFITEFLTDGSLRQFVRRHRMRLSTAAVKRYAWQILQGLVYLHGHYPPIIHRDLKCDNIFINGSSGQLVIGDLGFATLQKGLENALSVIGTPEFMAPELYDERYDEKVDIYSFGMCVLEMATQEYPYAECTNPAQIYKKVLKGEPPKGLQRVSDPLTSAFISTCIATDPAARPEARRLLAHAFFDEVRPRAGAAAPNGTAPLSPLARASAPLSAAARASAAVEGAGSGAAGGAGSKALAVSCPHVERPVMSINGSFVCHAQSAAGSLGTTGAAAAEGGLRPGPAVEVPEPGPQHAAELPAAAGGGRGLGPVVATVMFDASNQVETAAAGGRGACDKASRSSSSSHQQKVGGSSSNGEASAAGGPSAAAPAGQLPPCTVKTVQGSPSSSGDAEVLSPFAAVAAEAVEEREDGLAAALQSRQSNSVYRTSCSGSSPGSSCSRHEEGHDWTNPTRRRSFDAVWPTSCSPDWGSGHLRGALSPIGGGGGPLGPWGGVAVGSGSGGQAAGVGGRGCNVGSSSCGTSSHMDDLTEEDVLWDQEEEEERDVSSPFASTARHHQQHPHHTPTTSPRHADQHHRAFNYPLGPHSPDQVGPVSPLARRSSLGACPVLQPIAEDEEGVDCVCRQVDASQLSFNVHYVNPKGLRKHVGFEYDVDADTVEEVTYEMLQNLSLRQDQADSIAEKIRLALEALGIDTSIREGDDSGPTCNWSNGYTPTHAATSSSTPASGASAGSLGQCRGLDLMAGGPLLMAAAAAGVPEPLLGTLSGLSQEQQDMVEQQLLQSQGL